MFINKKLNKLYHQSRVIMFDSSSKFIILSDCHRGQGNHSDNFLPNQNIFYAALDYYYHNNYTYIEIGDGDELWENRNIDDIIQAHTDAFQLMSKFYYSNRLYMLYGNHDMVKRNKKFCNNSFCNYYNKTDDYKVPLFPEISVYESLLLKNKQSSIEIFLIHGHQGDLLNDTLWLVGRWLVRYIWQPIEQIGFTAPANGARTYKSKNKIEEALSQYANSANTILIAGHTHRPAFSPPGEALYFNDGSCVHPSCITGIEICNDEISLIKWSVKPNNHNILFITKDILEGPINLNLYF
ncbi:metallophosphoesterase [Lachnotalea glycerini]|uniref:Serine/threonine protein phosphatase n=1 Tax=Lachnotalea glycerini TaxID=1763509 RepID=A0A371JAN8_9FIRM|nr:metallophosphoesterase [Lachnotalea glycerini]RDY29831.1 serine/threonine protein phosphatase [Lachnotalea glycerini]